MKKIEFKVRDITYIALGVVIMLIGGMLIFQMSLIFPIHGVKYILLAPYLAMVFFVILSKIKNSYGLLKIGCVFGFIMTMMNLYMGITIVITSILTQVTIVPFSQAKKPFWGSMLFSAYTGIIALMMMKYMIGGAFEAISNRWIFATGLICFMFGALGATFAKKIMSHLS